MKMPENCPLRREHREIGIQLQHGVFRMEGSEGNRRAARKGEVVMTQSNARYLGTWIFVFFLVLSMSLIGMTGVQTANAQPASEKYPSYSVIKGGYYYPTEPISIDEFGDIDFDRETGFNGEIAFGHHYGPVFGTEFGIGYFETRRFPGIGPGRTRVESLPLLLSAKLFVPLGPIEPYGEIGIGAYFSKLEVEGEAGGSRAFREVDWGPHAGLGLNLNVTDTFYLGLEGRYRWVKPEYDGLTARLDGYTATLNVGFRY
jgi:opacity protein-like surface antigen